MSGTRSRHGRVARVSRGFAAAILGVAAGAVVNVATAPPAAAQSGLEQSKTITTDASFLLDDAGPASPDSVTAHVTLKQNGLDVPGEAAYPTAFADIYTGRAAVVEVQSSRFGDGPVATLASWMAPNGTDVTVTTSGVECALTFGQLVDDTPAVSGLDPSQCSGAHLTAAPQTGGVSTTGVIYVADDFTEVAPHPDTPYAGSEEFHAVKGATLHVPAPGLIYNAVTGQPDPGTGQPGTPCVASVSSEPDGMTVYRDGSMTYTPPDDAEGGELDVTYHLGQLASYGDGLHACNLTRPAVTGTVTIFLSGASPATVIPISVIAWGPYGAASPQYSVAFPANGFDPANPVATGSVTCSRVWNSSAASDLSSLAGSRSYPIDPGSCTGASASGDVTFSYSGVYYVAPSPQTLSFAADSVPSTAAAGDTFTPTVISDAGLNAVISVSGACHLDGTGGVTMDADIGGDGNCAVNAYQAGNDDYAAARISRTVGPAPAFAAQGVAALGEIIPVVGTGWPANARVAIMLYAPNDTEVARTSVVADGDGHLPAGTALTIPKDGAAGIYALAAEDKGAAASQVKDLTVLKTPTLSLPNTAGPGDAITVSGSGWTAEHGVSIAPYDDSGQQVSHASLTADAGGTIQGTIDVPSGAANGVYDIVADANGPSPVTTSTAIGGPFDQTLSFATAGEGVIPNHPLAYGETFRPEASSDSGLTPVISVSGACSRDGSTGVVTMTASSGTCTVTADQAGNDFFRRASISRNVGATQATQRLTMVPGTFPADELAYGTTFTPAAVSSAGLIPVIHASGACKADPDTGVVTVTSGTGECDLMFSQDGDVDYAPVTALWSASATAANQTVAFTSAAPATASYGGSYTPTAEATSGGVVTIALDDASDSGVCTVTDGIVTFTGVGSCVIDADQAGDDDYRPAEATQTITVGRADLVITASSPSGIGYGDVAPGISPNYSGLQFADTPADLDGTVACATTYHQGDDAGTYPTSCSGGTVTSRNYAISYVGGTLTVHRARLIVTAKDAMREYGAANPAFGATVTGFVNGDTAGSAYTGTPSFSTTATASSDPGSYRITPTAGSLASRNYSFSFEPGTLTIGKAATGITAMSASMTWSLLHGSFRFRGTLLSASAGSPVAGQQIAFSFADAHGRPGPTECTATTDASGVAECSARLSLSTLLRALTSWRSAAVFSGSVDYSSSSAIVPDRL